jgi:DNA mismatch repair protein MSH2
MRIEIWKQNRTEWQLIRRASPGNLQDVEDFLFTTTQMTSAPVVIAVKYGVSGDNKVKFFFKKSGNAEVIDINGHII